MYFSDVYADRLIPADVRGHKLLYGALITKFFPCCFIVMFFSF